MIYQNKYNTNIAWKIERHHIERIINEIPKGKVITAIDLESMFKHIFPDIVASYRLHAGKNLKSDAWGADPFRKYYAKRVVTVCDELVSENILEYYGEVRKGFPGKWLPVDQSLNWGYPVVRGYKIS